MPRKSNLSSDSGNPSYCRLCGSVKDVTYNCKNLLKKANEELHAALEAVNGRSLTHLYLRCQRKTMSTVNVLRRNSFIVFSALIAESQSLREEQKGERFYTRVFEVSPCHWCPELCRVEG